MPTTFLRTNAPLLTAAGLIAGVALIATGLWPLRVIGVACLAVALLVPFLRLGPKPKSVASNEAAAEPKDKPTSIVPPEPPRRGGQSFVAQRGRTASGKKVMGWQTRHAQQAPQGQRRADVPSPGVAKPANRPHHKGDPGRVTKHDPNASQHH